MPKPLTNYLRTFRRAAGLTQKDIAYLLSLPTASQVSRIERSVQYPNLRTSFAYEIIFQAALRRLFSGLYVEVEKQALKRGRRLILKIEKAARGKESLRRLEALKTIVESRGDITDLPR